MEDEKNLPTWKQVWRQGIAPQLSDKGLIALEKVLMDDDPRLIQGSTTQPPPLDCVGGWDVEAACPVGFCGWNDGAGRRSVREVDEFFAMVAFECDKALGEPAACRWALNWIDETPRAEMIRELLPEVQRELTRRANLEPAL